MIAVQDQVDLLPLNSLGLPAVAARYATPETEAALSELVSREEGPIQVLGEGSNVVLGSNIEALVIRPGMAGISVQDADADSVLIEAGAAVHWDDLVAWSVDQAFHGLENLSWIPGSVGAAPYQNIGAYGVELSDRLVSLHAVNLNTGKVREFQRGECDFAYRDSLFKSGEPGRWAITRVVLRLQRKFDPQLDYGDLAARFAALPDSEQNGQGLRQLVIRIRDEKLPDPARLANVGSFFKNPTVSAERWQTLKSDFPDLVGYPLADGDYKLAAGWLIEQAGWKGRRLGPVGMHERQALVLVNYGDATATDVLSLQQAVKASVREKFDVLLEREPVWLPRDPEAD